METRIVNVASSFVLSRLKILSEKGSGEAKIFVSSIKDEENLDNFFNNFNSNNVFIFEKSNLIDYLKKSYIEYVLNIINKYKHVDKEYFDEKLRELEADGLSEVINFRVEKYTDSSRYYIRAPKEDKVSRDIIDKYIRGVALPKITDLIIEKDNNEFRFKLKLNLDKVKEGEQENLDFNLECNNEHEYLSIEEVADKLKDILSNKDEENKYNLFLREREEERNNFLKSFSIPSIENIEQDRIKDFLFGKAENNSLVYNLCHVMTEFGSAKQSDTNKVDWPSDDFIQKLKEIDDFINRNDKNEHTLEKYQEIYKTIADITFDYFESRIWFKKYLHILYPKYIPSQHRPSNKKDILSRFNLEINDDESINAAKLLYLQQLSGVSSDYFWHLVDGFSKDNQNYIECLSSLIKHKNIQDLYFGAPGTGKSYEVSQLIKTIYPTVSEKENPFVFKTTIYSDYSYYDFIGNLVPKHNEEGQLEYGFTPGVFTQALAQALNHEDKEIFLVVEEMSRGNIASIFGDIFQLLDRDEEGKSEYSINNDLITNFLNKPIEEGGIGKEIKKISLPRNLHIIGTVNTSDQNVNVIDTAFKRRFGFIYSDVEPIKDDNGQVLNSFEFELEGQIFEWNRFYMSLNSFITEDLELSEDKQIGQFFIKFGNFQNDEERYEAIQNKLLHYLWEDVQSMAVDESKSIFDKGNYKTFSQLYKGFKNRENIFSEDLVKKYDKTTSYIG